MTNWRETLQKFAATDSDLLPAMEELGWRYNGKVGEYSQFVKEDTTVHVKYLQGTIFSWQAYGEVDSATTELLDGMT